MPAVAVLLPYPLPFCPLSVCVLCVYTVGEGVPSPSSKVLVSGSYDTTVRFWDLNTFRCMRKCDGHNDAVRVLAAYNGRVVSGSYDGTIGVSGVVVVGEGDRGYRAHHRLLLLCSSQQHHARSLGEVKAGGGPVEGRGGVDTEQLAHVCGSCSSACACPKHSMNAFAAGHLIRVAALSHWNASTSSDPPLLTAACACCLCVHYRCGDAGSWAMLVCSSSSMTDLASKLGRCQVFDSYPFTSKHSFTGVLNQHSERASTAATAAAAAVDARSRKRPLLMQAGALYAQPGVWCFFNLDRRRCRVTRCIKGTRGLNHRLHTGFLHALLPGLQ